MPDMPSLDGFDLRILAALQEDGRLTTQELAERVRLSASQCSRRRARLEGEGVICGYRAVLDRERLGFGLLGMIRVNLSTHSPDNARRFAALVGRLPEVIDAYAMTGQMDYLVKVATRDLAGLKTFVADVLLPHESVSHVETAIVLETLKEGGALPLLEEG